MRQVLGGSTDVSTNITIVDSGDGTPETGVTSVTAGLALEYVRLGAAPVSITESDLVATNSAHTDGGMKHLGYGHYRLDLPDAAVATGVDTVDVIGTVTGMIVLRETIQLVGYNPRTQLTSSVLAYLDAAITSRLAPTTSGRTLDVTATGAAGIDLANVENQSTVLGLSGTTIKAVTDQVTAGSTQVSITTIASLIGTPLNGANVVLRRGDSLSWTLTGLGSLTGYTSLWLTVKPVGFDTPDAKSLFQIKKNTSGTGDGLLCANGAAAGTAADGSITIDSAAAGDITIALQETVTDDFAPGLYRYDIQKLVSGVVTTLTEGEFEVVTDVTQAIA